MKGWNAFPAQVYDTHKQQSIKWRDQAEEDRFYELMIIEWLSKSIDYFWKNSFQSKVNHENRHGIYPTKSEAKRERERRVPIAYKLREKLLSLCRTQRDACECDGKLFACSEVLGPTAVSSGRGEGDSLKLVA